MTYEKQNAMLERGRQIGQSSMNGDILRECAVQKKDGLYLVYFLEGDLGRDPFGENGTHTEECRSFTDLAAAAAYISSKGFDIGCFLPQKGSRIFIPEHYVFT